jgi:hypothetical protein
MMTKQRGERPIVGPIIDAKEAWTHMRATAASLQGVDLLVISAYMTIDGLRGLLADLCPSNRVSILVRWQPNDLVTGASDLASFDFAAERGWEFFASPSLHAKAFVFGETAIFIGSANLTRNGFGLGTSQGNTETLTQVPATNGNIKLLQRMFGEGMRIDAPLVDAIRAWLNKQPIDSRVGAGSDLAWPLEANAPALRQYALSCLTVSECFMSDGAWAHEAANQCTPLVGAQRHDWSLLGQVTWASPMRLAQAMRQTKIFQWLEQQLNVTPDKTLYFGAISAALHEALIDDPRPYRRDVKALVIHLLAWIKLVPECGVEIDRPNHSERVRLVLRPPDSREKAT